MIRTAHAHIPSLCLYTDSQNPSGMGEHMLTLAGELRHAYQVTFACPAAQTGQSFLKRAQRLGCLALPVDGAAGSDAENRLYNSLREERVDILHCHAGISWEGHNIARIARAAGVTAIVRTEHLPYLLTDRKQQIEYRESVEAVDRLICVSDEARRTFMRAGLPEEKFVTVRNGISTPRFGEWDPKLRTKLKLPRDAKIVLTVARFTEQKGHRYLLHAIPGVVAVHPSAHFVWVGTGPLENTLKRAARDQFLEQHISFLGNREDVLDLMSEADVFVLPSEFEGLPLVLLEAMAAGVPVVGSRACGIREVVRNGVSGRLVPVSSPAALATAILEVLLDPNKAAQWARRAQERVMRAFTAERMVRETAAVYSQLLPNFETNPKTAREIFA